MASKNSENKSTKYCTSQHITDDLQTPFALEHLQPPPSSQSHHAPGYSISSSPFFLFFFKFSTEFVQLSGVLLWVVAKLILTQREYSMLLRFSLLLFVASLLGKTPELIAELRKLYESLQHLKVLVLILACYQKIFKFCFF